MSQAEQREEVVFEAALQLAAGQRAAYLDDVCAGDADLRHRVDILLGAFERAGGFMKQAAVPERTVRLSLPPTEKPGDRVGHYKLLEQIGEGGCGVVYVAEQEAPVRRRVALKVIKLGMDTKQVIARFDAERQALAMMDHPNIAKIFDAGITDAPHPQLSTLNPQLSPGRPYFVMELVRGIKITDYCDQNHLAPRERLDLFIQVCRAIQHAHQKGIIHRDIKPSNILVTLHDGVPVPKVIDFGIAKATQGRLTDQTVYTAFEQFIGTPAYMSPEQAEMSGLDIDTRSDIYSLGVLLYELLTGKTPFDAKELLAAGLDEMRRTIREVEPVKPSTRLTQELVAADVRSLHSKSAQPSTLNPQPEDRASSRRLLQLKELIHALRGDLDWIVMKCLEKDRTRRYETANGLATDISCHLNNEPVVARPPSALYRWQKFVRRNKQTVAAATVIALAVLLGLVVSSWQWREAVHARQDAEAKAKSEAAAKKEADQQRITALENLYAADMSLAQRALEEGNLGRVRSLLDLHRPKAGEVDFRGFEWRYLLKASSSQSVFTLRGHADVVGSVAFSPDGKTVATASWDRTVKLWDVASQQLLTTLTNFGDKVSSVAFSPDGQVLATASSDHLVRFWDLTRYTVSSTYNVTSAHWVAFSPVDKILVVAAGGSWVNNSGDVKLINYATGQEIRSFPQAGNRVAISRDGRRLAIGAGPKDVTVWDMQTGERLRTFDVGVTDIDANNPVLALTLSFDGQLLAFCDFAGRVQVWDIESGQLVATPISPAGRAGDLAFSPKENLLAQASSDATVRLWTVNARERFARPVATLRGHSWMVASLAFSPDGKLLISGEFERLAMLWNLKRDKDDNALTNSFMNHATCRAVVSPDGKALAAMTGEQSVGVWDLATGQLRSVFEGEAFALAVFSNAEQVVTLSTNLSLHIWNVTKRNLERTVALSDLAGVSFKRSDKDGVFCATLSPDGKTLVTGLQNGTIIHWNAVTGARLATLHNHTGAVRMMVFSPDGRRLLTAARDHTAKVLDLTTHQEIASLKHRGEIVFSAAFSPDGKTVATGTGDTTLWDARSGEEIAIVQAHKAGVFWVAYSPDGRTLATASDDRTVKLWNLATRRELATLQHEKPVLYAGFTPDGRTLVTGTLGGPISLWRASAQSED